MRDMRLTNHNSRTTAAGEAYSPKHNDRNGIKADHINPEKSHLNWYWHCMQKESPWMTFEDVEKTFYKIHCTDHLNAQNARYKTQRHPERCKNMDNYRKSPQTCPEETIYTIGNKNNHISARVLKNICSEFIDWEQKRFPGIYVLSISLHCDEDAAAPHIHERKAWLYVDKNGYEAIGQGKVLEQLGIERPHPEKPKSRYNNPKQTYTKLCREKLFEICQNHGLELIREPKERSHSGLSLIKYKAQQEENKAQTAEHRRHISEQMALIAQYEQKQEEQRTMDYLTEQNRLKAKIRYLENEIEELEADHREIRFDVVLASNTLNDMIAEKNETYRKLSKSISELQKKEYEEQKRLEHLQTFLSHAEKRKLAHLYEKDNNNIER